MAAAKKKAPGKALAKWDEQLAALAERAAKQEAHVGGGGTFIKTRGGVLVYDGAEVPGNKMNVVIIDSVLENAFYDGKFDPDSPAPPVCYAFGAEARDMAPHAESTEPQSASCAECPHNKWASADQGRGKACKNIHRLALIPEDALESADAIEDAELAFIKVPVTSGKAYAGYVRQLKDNFMRPPLAFVTELSLVRDAETQFKMQFKLVEQIEDGDLIGALLAKAEKAAGELEQPYTPADEEDTKPVRRGANGRRAVVPSRAPAPSRGRRAAPEPEAEEEEAPAPRRGRRAAPEPEPEAPRSRGRQAAPPPAPARRAAPPARVAAPAKGAGRGKPAAPPAAPARGARVAQPPAGRGRKYG
jgi:hypothetical protein